MAKGTAGEKCHSLSRFVLRNDKKFNIIHQSFLGKLERKNLNVDFFKPAKGRGGGGKRVF